MPKSVFIAARSFCFDESPINPFISQSCDDWNLASDKKGRVKKSLFDYSGSGKVAN
jgi:hypothetical protein